MLENFNLGDWILRAKAEAKIAQRKNPLSRLIGEYCIEDYDIRKKGDHFESYNKLTGEGLFEASTYREALADLREEFAI